MTDALDRPWATQLRSTASLPVIIPAAGRGTRLGPIGMATPKELLPVVDRPAIFHVLAEAAAVSQRARIVTRPSTAPVLAELTAAFHASGPPADEFEVDWVIQEQPVGLGHAVRTGWVGDGPQLVLVPDEILGDEGGLCRQMLEVHRRTGGSVLALRRVPTAELRSKGCATVLAAPDLGAGVVRIEALMEKPVHPPEGSFAIIGRYVLASDVQASLRDLRPGRLGELQLSEALNARKADPDGAMYGMIYSGPWYDLGTVEGYLSTVLNLASDRL